MADLANQFEGVADATVMTTANSATSGDAFDAIFSNGAQASGALAYSSAAAVFGSRGCRITLAAAASYARWTDSSGTGRRIVRRTVKVGSLPTSGEFVLARIGVGNTLMGDLRLLSTGVFRCSASGTTIVASSSPSVTVGNTYIIDLAVTPGTTTSNGRVEYRVTNAPSGSAFGSYDSGATVNTGTAEATQARAGGGVTGQGWTVDDMDDCRFVTLASGWPALLSSNSTPTANAGPDQTVEAGQAVTLSLSGTDTDGTIAAYNLTQTAGPIVTVSGSGAGASTTRTFTAPITMAGTTLTFSLTVTDNGGAVSATDTVTITVLPAAIHLMTATGIKPAIRRMA